MVNRRMRATALVTAACVDSACNDAAFSSRTSSPAVAHQRGQEGGTTSATSHKGKVAARLAAAFGLTSLREKDHIRSKGTPRFMRGALVLSGCPGSWDGPG